MDQTNEAVTSLTELSRGEDTQVYRWATERPDGCSCPAPAFRPDRGGTLTGAETQTSFRPNELEVCPDGAGHLLGSRCSSCDAHFFPVREACAGCLGSDLETIRFSTTGTLYTFSIVRQSTPEFEVPYALGYVDFIEGVRIMGQITGCDFEDMRIGMPLVLSLEPFGEDDEGNPLTGYRFQPCEVEGD
jgi:hypothetical protein|tara:strand:+ start:1355 stop:1918 length:564 start_codon:yes stop_codon:yes gene_type:complete